MFLHTPLSRIALVSLLAGVFVAGAACSSDDDAGAVPNPNGMAAGAVCKENSECQSLSCKDGKCTAPTGGNPADGKRNGDETDVDCGGTSANRCADLKSCKVGGDCANAICDGGKCIAPKPDDGAKNADESDVDCGGATAPKCAVGKACGKHEDCASGACNYAKKCVEAKSCTGHFGGDTCGAGETGTADAKHESCCATVADANGTQIGKYQVTAGRMRAFIERYNGNLKEWASTAPAGWNASWTEELPASIDSALIKLGPAGKRGCNVGGDGGGGRTYWQPPIDGDAAEVSDWSKDVLDEKALNCVPWQMAQALCMFDGGRLISHAEAVAQVKNNGATTWPWGNEPAFVKGRQIDQIVHADSYMTPNPPATLRTYGADDYLQDKAGLMAPPGRRPLGANKIGVADAIGNMMPWVNDGIRRFTWTGSWETSHGFQTQVGTWPNAAGGSTAIQEGYWAIGARCAFPK